MMTNRRILGIVFLLLLIGAIYGKKQTHGGNGEKKSTRKHHPIGSRENLDDAAKNT
jgi:hypothetical protein